MAAAPLPWLRGWHSRADQVTGRAGKCMQPGATELGVGVHPGEPGAAGVSGNGPLRLCPPARAARLMPKTAADETVMFRHWPRQHWRRRRQRRPQRKAGSVAQIPVAPSPLNLHALSPSRYHVVQACVSRHLGNGVPARRLSCSPCCYELADVRVKRANGFCAAPRSGRATCSANFRLRLRHSQPARQKGRW